MPQRRLNVLFVGGGSLGAIYGYVLSKQNCAVTIAVRSSYPIISKNGYNIKSVHFGSTRWRPERVVSSATQLARDEVFDYIVVCTKATSTSFTAVPTAGYPVSPRTTIVLVQNGIGVEEPFMMAHPGTKILSVVAYIAASQPSPGEIVESGVSMRLILGPYGETKIDERDKALIGKLAQGGVPTSVVENIQATRWNKLLFNGCFATVCAATGLDTLAAMEASGGRELMMALGEEIRQTACASGCPMEKREVEEFFHRLRMLDMTPSMLQDARKGVQMEVEVLCGNVWRIAERVGVQTPRIKTMYTILNGMNIRFRQERKKKPDVEGNL